MRICSVPYYNTLPLSWFLPSLIENIEFQTNFPANLATALHDRTVDIAMMPVGALCELEHGEIISNACIACDGAVASVLMFSRKPLEQIQTIALDRDSRTSVALGQILLREFYGNKNYQIQPLLRTEPLDQIVTDAIVVIGDRALTYFPEKTVWPLRFDLGELWHKQTSLPFVFAAWTASNSEVICDLKLIKTLEKSRDLGMMNLESIAYETILRNQSGNSVFPYPISEEQLLKYFQSSISYTMTEKHRQGLELFLELMKNAVVCH